jgi:general secretion pathway protein I
VARNGFTLVEMLVAMLLLSLVGLALVQFQTFQLAGAARLSTAALARIEADNLAVSLAVLPEAPREALSGTSSNGGRTLFWRIEPGPAPDPRLPTMVMLTIEVAAGDGAPALARRTVLRPA